MAKITIISSVILDKDGVKTIQANGKKEASHYIKVALMEHVPYIVQLSH